MDDDTAVSEDTAKTATILLVDEDVKTMRVVQEALKESHVNLSHAHSAAEARQFLTACEPTLIILNLVLPDADGRNVLTEFQQDPATAAIPLFVVLGFLGPQPREECLRLGATEVLEKPLYIDEVGDKLTSALAHATDAGRDSQYDSVTGLPNRAALAEAYRHAASDASAQGKPCTLALLDLDRLSDINSQYGRHIGDKVLKGVGSSLVAALRDTDVVSRWEEDEYVLLFPNTDLRTAVLTVTKAQAAVRSSPVVQEGNTTVTVSFSAGVTSVPPDAPLEEAVARADGVLLRAKAEGHSRILSSDDEAPESKLTLLVAEDDRVAAALVRHRLERAGFEVLHRANGAEALELAFDNSISLFVLDIRMPGMDGIELLKRLRESEQYAKTPILMLTSLGREEDIVRAFNLGASDYLTKPFSPVELLARVQRLLRRSGFHRMPSTS